MKKLIAIAAALVMGATAISAQDQVPFGKVWASSFFKGWYAELDSPSTNTDWSEADAPTGKYSYTAQNLTYTTTQADINQWKSNGNELKTGKPTVFSFVNGGEGKAKLSVTFRSTAENSKRTLQVFVNDKKVGQLSTLSNQYEKNPSVLRGIVVAPGDVVKIGPCNTNYILKRIAWEADAE